MGSDGGREPDTGRTRRPDAVARVDVLVIDDSDLMRSTLKRALVRAGLSVTELGSPIGATRAMFRRQPRVVLIDLDMPTMRGDQLIRVLRDRHRIMQAKLVLMSAHGEEELRAIAAAVGADAVVAKANGTPGIVAAVRRLLGDARTE